MYFINKTKPDQGREWNDIQFKIDTFEKAAGRNKPDHYLEEKHCRQRCPWPQWSILGLLEDGTGARKKMGGAKVREGARGWVWRTLQDMRRTQMDSKHHGKPQSVVWVWRMRRAEQSPEAGKNRQDAMHKERIALEQAQSHSTKEEARK